MRMNNIHIKHVQPTGIYETNTLYSIITTRGSYRMINTIE